jgi:hypothetical protein
MSDTQIGGDHYKKCKIQPWDYVIANDLDYFQGSIIKYVTRWKDKGWTQDLHKAKHFLDKYIETMEVRYIGLKERPSEREEDRKETHQGPGQAQSQGSHQGT